MAEPTPNPFTKASSQTMRDRQLFEDGVKQGRREAWSETLEWIRVKYTEAEDRPDRGSVRAGAMLTIAKDLADYIRSMLV